MSHLDPSTYRCKSCHEGIDSTVVVSHQDQGLPLNVCEECCEEEFLL